MTYPQKEQEASNMLFNSIDFAIFLPIIFILYWFVFKKTKSQNVLLLIASYVFYGWWDWRFLSLIVFSSLVDYIIGLQIFKSKKKKRKKHFLWISLGVNLGFLGFFKYYNFFIDSFVDAFSLFGSEFESNRLNIVLPVGISFYTFQTLSYSIDIYKKKMTPTKDIIAFFSFVSFFPQLVAGPIERAKQLLPQFYKNRAFDYRLAQTGLLDIAWGLFKKVVVADTLAIYVNQVYGDINSFEGFPIIWATLFFTFQIYCDFSGYSSIAIGTAKLFGFNLMQNFKRPYLSKSFTEFWSRWHISLSTWFRDYVYIPLGGNRVSKFKRNVNLMLTFTISGLWHGANWTFIVWGALHGLFNIMNKALSGKIRLPSIITIITLFILTNLLWVFFRAENISDAFYALENIIPTTFDAIIGVPIISKMTFVKFFILVFVLVLIDVLIERKSRKVDDSNSMYPASKTITAYVSILFIIIYSLGVFEQQEFIYFQF